MQTETIRDENDRPVFEIQHIYDKQHELHFIKITSLVDKKPIFESDDNGYINPFLGPRLIDAIPLGIHIRVKADDHLGLFDLFFQVDTVKRKRWLDILEEYLDKEIDRDTHFARMVDIHFSRRTGGDAS